MQGLILMSEERVAALEAYREGDKEVLREVSDKLDTVATDVQTIRMQLEKQKGFFAGCMFILLPIWSVITAVVISLWDRLMGSGTN